MSSALPRLTEQSFLSSCSWLIIARGVVSMLGGWIRRGSGPMVLDLTNHGFILSVLDVSGAAPRSAIFSRPGALSLRRKWQSIFRRHSCGWLCLAHASALERSPVTNLDGP